MNIHERLKLKIKEKDTDLVDLVSVLVIPIIFLVYFVIKGCLIHITYLFSPQYPASLSYGISWEIYILIILLIFFTLFVVFLYQTRNFRKTKKEEDCCEKIVVFKNSKSLARKKRYLFLPNLLAVYFRREYFSYQKCLFKLVDETSDDFFYYLLSKSDIKCLKEIYEVHETFWDVGILIKDIEFRGNIPIQIIYGRNSHVLKAVLAVPYYNYTDRQLDAIKNWNQLCFINQIDIDYNIFSFANKKHLFSHLKRCYFDSDLFPSIFLILLGVTALISFVFLTTIGIIDSICNDNEFWLEFFGLCLLLYILSTQVPNRGEKTGRSKSKWKDQNFITEKMEFVESYTLNVFHSSLSMLFQEEKASNHRLILKRLGYSSDYNQQEELIYTISRDKLHVLKEFCDYDVNYENYRPMSIHIMFKNSVPLMVTYGRKYRLERICPVEGYEYTEAQLAAIEKFNTLYP